MVADFYKLHTGALVLVLKHEQEILEGSEAAGLLPL